VGISPQELGEGSDVELVKSVHVEIVVRRIWGEHFVGEVLWMRLELVL